LAIQQEMMMPFWQIDSLKIYQFGIFNGYQLTHGIVTRRGGISPDPWKSLNVGASVGDDLVRVNENRDRIFRTLGRDPASRYDVWQVHSNNVQIVETPRGHAPPIQADIIVTNRPQVTLLMRFADCVPIFLYDPQIKAIALIHAGRLGLARRAPQVAVRALTEKYGSKPQDILAGVGPSICPDCYSVGEDVLHDFEATLGKDEADRYFHQEEDHYHLNLWKCAEDQLESMGVKQIENSGICTAMNLSDWYSHRAEKGRTGRFAAMLGLAT
jgi:YfiH family protein